MSLKDKLASAGFIDHGRRMSYDILEKHHEDGVIQIVHLPINLGLSDSLLQLIADDEDAPAISKDRLNQDLTEEPDTTPIYTTVPAPDGKNHIIRDPMGNPVLTLPPTEFAVIGAMYDNALRTKTIAFANALMFGYVLGHCHSYLMHIRNGSAMDLEAMDKDMQALKDLNEKTAREAEEKAKAEAVQDAEDAERLMTPSASVDKTKSGGRAGRRK